MRSPGEREQAFLDALARAIAASIRRELARATVAASDPEPRANATPGLTPTAYDGGDRG